MDIGGMVAALLGIALAGYYLLLLLIFIISKWPIKNAREEGDNLSTKRKYIQYLDEVSSSFEKNEGMAGLGCFWLAFFMPFILLGLLLLRIFSVN